MIQHALSAFFEEDKKTTGTRGSLIRRNIMINGRRTSVRLEADMWSGLMEVCRRENLTIHEACTVIATSKAASSSLASGIRTFIVRYYRANAANAAQANNPALTVPSDAYAVFKAPTMNGKITTESRMETI